jgi:cytochrome b561
MRWLESPPLDQLDGMPPDGGALRLAVAFRRARSRYRSAAPRILLLMLGWAGVWVILEILVVGSGSPPGRPTWLLLHLGYFWGTAYWEAAILRSALAVMDAAPPPRSETFLEHRVASGFLALKLMMLPLVLAGLALLVAPGLYGMARLGPAFFIVVGGRAGPLEALRLSLDLTRGRSGPLLLLCLFLLVFNIFGAALLGLGLLVTVPISALMFAHAFRALGG